MRRTLVGLVMVLTPLSLGGQTLNITCPEEECHVGPYFYRAGGFVGEARSGVTEVGLAIACSDRSIGPPSPIMPDSNGRVAHAISEKDSCPSGGGVLVIRGLEDGGWYYVNDESGSSAVSPLIPLSVLSDPAATQQPFDPGGLDVRMPPDIEINDEPYTGIGVYFKHDPSGRVGLFPTVAASRRTATCEQMQSDGSVPKNECYLDAVYTARITVTVGGQATIYANGETITRTASGGADLTLVPEVHAAGNVQTDVAFNEFAGGNAPTVTGSTGSYGIAAPAGAANSVDISPSAGAGERCEANNRDRDTTLPVKWTFAAANIEGDAPIVQNDLEVEILVACPPASSNAGVELVPSGETGTDPDLR